MSKKVFVIGISGTTNSGKSTLAERLVEEIPNATHVYQDHYFLHPNDSRLSPLYIPELNHHNWEDHRALEMDQFVQDVKQMIEEAEETGNGSVILVDGYSIFGWKPLASLIDRKYFLMVEKDVCFERRQQRTYDPPDVPGYFEQVAWPKHLEHLKAIEDQDDIEYFKTDDSLDSMVARITGDINKFWDGQCDKSDS